MLVKLVVAVKMFGTGSATSDLPAGEHMFPP